MRHERMARYVNVGKQEAPTRPEYIPQSHRVYAGALPRGKRKRTRTGPQKYGIRIWQAVRYKTLSESPIAQECQNLSGYSVGRVDVVYHDCHHALSAQVLARRGEREVCHAARAADRWFGQVWTYSSPFHSF